MSLSTVQASGTGVAGTAMAVLVFEKEQMSFLKILAQSSLSVASFPGAPPRTGNEATLGEAFFIAADIQRMMRVHPEFICASITYQHMVIPV